MKYHGDNYQADHNYVIFGDFNMYTSNEQGFINLTADPNRAIRFKDPINKPGSWNNSGAFASVHTQSTRVSGSCHSGGGLDDRFDFVLCGQELLDNTRGLAYIPGSYRAVGNDGNHFNSSINTGTNSAVPSAVLTALYEMSDHLPVEIKMGINRTIASVSEQHIDNFLVVSNPVGNQLHWRMQVPQAGNLVVTDIQGKEVLSYALEAASSWVINDVSNWTQGAYYLTFTAGNGEVLRRKVVKL